MPVCVCVALRAPLFRATVPPALIAAQRLEPPDPAGPVGPFAPWAPGAPGGPGGPTLPRGSWLAAKSTFSSAWSFTFDDVTAFAWSCLLPTLFAGRLEAAYPVPASATRSAIDAMTVAGDGRTALRALTMGPPSVVAPPRS